MLRILNRPMSLSLHFHTPSAASASGCYKSHSCQRFCSLPGWAGYGLHEEGIRSVGS